MVNPFDTPRCTPANRPCHPWFLLWALLLLLACAEETESTPAFAAAACPGPVPVGCRCLAGVAVCDGLAPAAGAPATDMPGTPTPGPGALPMAADMPGMQRDAGAQLAPMTQAEPGGDGPSGPVAMPDAGFGDPSPDPTGSNDEPDEPDEPDVGVGVVGQHGALRAQGNRVVDRAGQPIQLRGMSWFWSQWTDFYVPQNVDVMVDDWQATLVRAAMGVENEGGYLQDPAANVAKVRAIVDRAIARGVYVIIDWHDHHAQDHAAQATAFFEEMVQAYGDQPHVIFEVYNEPVDVSWSVVKGYAEQMVRTIRAAGSDNLIIVGTPTWSQDVDLAAADPITSDDNVAYTLHFYANTHRQSLRDKAQTALDRGIALFVTEWGTCSADGNGSIDEGETRTWLDFLRRNSISWANWSLHDKAEACSAVQPGGGSVGPWRDDQLTASGRLVKGAIP